MKVVLINGSPNAVGCTYTALQEIAATLAKEAMVHGWQPSDVKQDLEGLQTMRILARNMAWS